MKQIIGFLIILLVFSSCDNNITDNGLSDKKTVDKNSVFVPKYSFNNYAQRISYCIGLDQGASTKLHFETNGLKDKFRIKNFEEGLKDYLLGEDLKVLPNQIDSIFNLYLNENGAVDSTKVSPNIASYAFGVSEAKVLIASFVARQIDQSIVVDLLVLGIEDGINGYTPSVPLKEARIEVMTHYSDINRNRGEEFLALNAKRKEVITTTSGLQYEIFEKGKGKKPLLMDSVLVHYTGRFIDGRVFDSSKPSNNPIRFSLLQVIPAWTEGLQLMKEGAEYRFFTPYQLAYGEEGFNSIEPYTALVFDIELIKILH